MAADPPAPPPGGSSDPHPRLPIDPDSLPRSPQSRALAWVLVFVGGVLGASLRIYLEKEWPPPPGGWPWATFCINIAGSFVLGVVLGTLGRLGSDQGWRQNTRMLAAVGLCATFTTYSTMALEITLLARGGHHEMAVGYGVGSVAIGIAAAWVGIQLAGIVVKALRGKAARS